jgi:propanol-preferring alcohol dehydrogenase
VKAYRLTAAGAAGLVDVERPVPAAGEALVRVAANGVCHTDVALIAMPDALPQVQLPLTLGHEVTGWVEQLGPGAEGVAPGTAVGVYSVQGCGRCPACMRGEDNACRAGLPASIGVDRDGGLAHYVAVPAHNLVALGPLDPVAAAPLMDAGLTSYRAVRAAAAHLRPGATCVVIGVGGLGHLAIQIVRALTPAKVVAVDKEPDRLAHAEDLGAAHVVEATGDAIERIREGCDGGADAVLDFVGDDETAALAGRAVAPGGTVALVGMGMGSLSLRAGISGDVPPEVSVLTTVYGSRADLRDVVALAGSGAIEATVTRFALDDADRAIAAVTTHAGRGRAVVIP